MHNVATGHLKYGLHDWGFVINFTKFNFHVNSMATYGQKLCWSLRSLESSCNVPGI